ncbi:large subunit ribosomal protein L9 [Lewinella marina]|uniref:Large ribosomal subunit protein bL9 n=1 Tax=Neolewinella marina TaxID=438751 RepID=A0A2G0CE20_9BACT|nr:50S ribosomal protein L9 [Neolewinella marina]NJB87473.1 large subunit ribosomal protein L9 [Neolewinella marina]PHK98219.1 50S ribosomal protein L9 [Neolewinella marina]
MKVIMLQDVDKVGDKHEVIEVKDGFGRNYLLPRGLAIIGNKSNMGRLEEMIRRENAQEQKKLDVYRDIAKKLEGKTLRVGAKSGTSGRIFGSITQLQIRNLLQEQFGVDVERKKIVLPEEAKELGTYKFTMRLHPEVVKEMDMEIVQE